ncbi:MAG: Na+/H+ antiporter NhaA [Dehalococcoidia bacterium]
MSGNARRRGELAVRAARSPFVRRVGLPVQRFISTEAASGAVLLAAIVVALIWANSPWADSYRALWATPVTVAIGGAGIDKPLLLWVNDGLMAIFFFVVGLEIKREFLHGELASPKVAALPIAGAFGGMITPALIYLAVNGGGPAARGWAIPMATDIALALGVLALLGRRIPAELRVFLLALAIVDDLGAIAVIALFFTEAISATALGIAALLFGLVLLAVRVGMRSVFLYLLLSALLWAAVLNSGVHATVAGVLLAMVVPASRTIGPDRFAELVGRLIDRLEQPAGEPAEMTLGRVGELVTQTEAPLERWERVLHPWVSYLIVPLFALANAGVALSGEAIGASPVAVGVAAGLLLGKPVGIVLASVVVVRLRLAVLPAGVRWSQIGGVGLLAGIGFTVALFIAELAFDSPALVEQAKVGILTASVAAGLIGYLALRLSSRPPDSRSAHR